MILLDYSGNIGKNIPAYGGYDNVFQQWYNNWMPWSLMMFIVAGVTVVWLCYYVIKCVVKSYRNTSFVVIYSGEQHRVKRGSRLFPEVPSKDGYVFLGWYKDSACTDRWGSNDKVKYDMTLYPKWGKES